MSDSQDDPSPLSYPVNVTRLPARGLPVRIGADSEQRAALAEAHGLLAVENFDADLTVSAWKRDGVRVSGKVRADIVQTCIVTLEPLPAHIEEDVFALFAPEGSRLLRPDSAEGGEILLDAEGPDSPEPFFGNEIDVGALAEEFLALGIPPYPRKAGAAVEPVESDETEAQGPMYDKLKRLRDRN
jgi:hypothetical protein